MGAEQVIHVMRPGRIHVSAHRVGPYVGGRLPSKIPALEALAGHFRAEHHGLQVAQMLAHIDFLEAAIIDVDATLTTTPSSAQTGHNVHQLEQLGHTVTLQPAPETTGPRPETARLVT